MSCTAQKKRKTFGRNFPLLLIDLACIESICCHSSVIFSTAVIMNVSELSGAKFDHFVPLSHASGLSFGPETATNVSMEENRQKREKIHWCWYSGYANISIEEWFIVFSPRQLIKLPQSSMEGNFLNEMEFLSSWYFSSPTIIDDDDTLLHYY